MLTQEAKVSAKKNASDFYLRVILPSVNYCHILWGACCNSDILDSLERLHCRAAGIIFNLPKDMSSHDVLERAEWFTIRFYYKLAVFKCMHNAYNGRLPCTLNNCIAKKRHTQLEHAIHYWSHVL